MHTYVDYCTVYIVVLLLPLHVYLFKVSTSIIVLKQFET